MKLCEIKIRKVFRKHKPSSLKMDSCREYFENHGTIDRDIVIDESGTLVDGYVGYLVLRENSIDEWDVKHLSENVGNVLLLIAGRHPNNEKIYYWLANGRTKGLCENITEDDLASYKSAYVETKYGPRKVVIESCTFVKYSDLVCDRKNVYRLNR